MYALRYNKSRIINLFSEGNAVKSNYDKEKLYKNLVLSNGKLYNYHDMKTVDDDNYIFMDMNDYSQIELPKSQIEEEVKFLTENSEVNIMYYNNEMLGVNLPEKVELEVVKTEPGVKGNTTSTATKEAVLSTGLTVRVPLFIDEGDIVIISTSDGKYVSRK